MKQISIHLNATHVHIECTHVCDLHFVVFPRMAVASHTNPASADTSQDSCGGQDNDKKMLFT